VRPGRSLRVTFLEGWLDVQQKISFYAQQWSAYANLSFLFTDDSDAEIRISFNPYEASWSALGTDALITELYPKQKPTMNLNCLTSSSDDQQYSRTVLHEFGHALGLIHEHQNPAGRILWNENAVIQTLYHPPYNWTLDAIQRDILRCDQTQTQFGPFDPESVMIYPIPQEWMLGGLSFHRNNTLSDIDKQFIRTCYPS
jgi:hypothetical protein